MSMNGVSNTLSFLSWIISGLIFVFLFVALPTIIVFSLDRGLQISLFNYGNKVLIAIVFIFYISHLLIFGIHISGYFKRGINNSLKLLKMIA